MNQQSSEAGQNPSLTEYPYHRLYRAQSNYRWWKPLLALLLSGVMVLSFSVFFGLLTAASIFITAGPDLNLEQLTEEDFLLDMAAPAPLTLGLLSIATWIPAFFFSLWAVGLKPLGFLNSVAGRLRWGMLGRYLIGATVVTVTAQAFSISFMFFTGNMPEPDRDTSPVLLIISVFVVLLLVPFQAAAEEYAFRGIVLQSLGSWMKNPILPILISSALFTFGHLYDVWGMAEVFVLGVVASWLVIRTGGLEAAIALHTMNNLIIFVLLATGLFGTTAQTLDGGSPFSLAVSVVMLAGYAVWVSRGVKAEQRVLRVPVESALAAQVQGETA